MIDLDHNATTPLDARVAAAMQAVPPGNPSSVHAVGRLARDVLEKARAEVAKLVGGAPGDIVFTSGGTEADVLAIVAGARAARAAGRPARVVTSPLEHPAVAGACAWLLDEGFEIVRVPVDALGRIDPEDVTRAGPAALASFALANHELGNLYDVAALAAAARRGGAFVHTDAVQAAGRVPLDAAALGVDLLSISAHKLHGPKGAGALWARRGLGLEPLHPGGHQERGLRPGTENVSGAVGLGAAARLASESLADMPRVASLRDRLEHAALAIPDARVHGDPARRIANTTNVAFTGAPGDLVVAALDLDAVAASTGAACTSGSVEPSPVVLALGQPRARAAESVRFSLGRDNDAAQIDRVAALLPEIVTRIRKAI